MRYCHNNRANKKKFTSKISYFFYLTFIEQFVSMIWTADKWSLCWWRWISLLLKNRTQLLHLPIPNCCRRKCRLQSVPRGRSSLAAAAVVTSLRPAAAAESPLGDLPNPVSAPVHRWSAPPASVRMTVASLGALVLQKEVLKFREVFLYFFCHFLWIF